MKKIIFFATLLMSVSIYSMNGHFSAADRNNVRIAVAKFIAQKNGQTIHSDEAVVESEFFKMLQTKIVVLEPDSRKASLIDLDTKTRYKVYLQENNRVKEKEIPVIAK